MLTIRQFEDQYMKGRGLREHHLVVEKYNDYFRENAKVGDGVTVHLYSDAHAYTIIRRTDKSLTLQRDKATLKNGWKPEIIPGGFAGHCINQEDQEYTYEQDENGSIVTAHWSQKKHGFYVQGSEYVTPGRREYYDYNF